MYKLVEKAKRYEKQGLHSKELEIYETIHQEYLPNSSNLYKRPAILYEKKGEYDKSLELCKKAVELIEADKISGTKKTFEKKIEILNRKLKQTSNKPKKHSSCSIIYLLIHVFHGRWFDSRWCFPGGGFPGCSDGRGASHDGVFEDVKVGDEEVDDGAGGDDDEFHTGAGDGKSLD